MGIDLTFCEMREKEVINIIDGRRLGRLLDIAFTANGNIIGIIVPGERRFFKNITGGDSIFIKWCNIVKIGEDAILVELPGGHRPKPDHHDDHHGGHKEPHKPHPPGPRPCPPYVCAEEDDDVKPIKDDDSIAYGDTIYYRRKSGYRDDNEY